MVNRLISWLIVAVVGCSLLGVAQGAPPQPQMKVDTCTKHDVSPPLADLKPLPPRGGTPKAMRVPKRVKRTVHPGSTGTDTLIQLGELGPEAMPAPIVNFEGINDIDGVAPPDTQGDVGLSHYIQWVNSSFEVFDKQGHLLYGPAAGSSLWQGFGGPCQNTNDGDPVTAYDEVADRWVMTQFSVQGPYYQCVAVSASGDPLGQWYRYAYLVDTDYSDDYPKMGVWPDGYYLTANLFDPLGNFWGAGVWAFERAKMLLGQDAQKIYVPLPYTTYYLAYLLPADVEGTAPPAGAPNILVEYEDNGWYSAPPPTYDFLQLFSFHADWTTPASSTFTQLPSVDIGDVNSNMCDYSLDCIAQPGTTQMVDAIAGNVMHRLQYRNFGTYQSLVTNLTANTNPLTNPQTLNHAAVRWMELRNPGTGWAVQNLGTYSPDTDNRFMGSAAMDRSGNIAIGYSVASSTTYPSIRYAGRLSTDPANTLGQTETTLIAGTGSETGEDRWGDYSSMQVDPVDGCTFWYTQMYYQTSGAFNWQTRVGSFKLPSCTANPTGVIHGTVTAAGSGTPIGGAFVKVGSTIVTTTAADGTYTVTVPPATYVITVSAYTYSSTSEAGVVVSNGSNLTRSYSLTNAAKVNVHGVVRDGGTATWPLHAVLVITVPGAAPVTLYSDPADGSYSLQLYQGQPSTFRVNSLLPGYAEAVRTVTPGAGGSVEDFLLTLDGCVAPGFDWNTVTGLSESFTSGSMPGGWKVLENAGRGAVWVFNNPVARTNLTGGTGGIAIGDSDYFGLIPMDTELRTPVMDFSGQASPQLQFKTDFYVRTGVATSADVDVTTDGGMTWTNVWRKTASYRGPKTETVNLTAQAANQPAVQLRFHYYFTYNSTTPNKSYWWQIDDVTVGTPVTPTCQQASGSLVWGYTFDARVGTRINYATVTAPGGGTATSGHDPILGDGFYQVFVASTVGQNVCVNAIAPGGYGNGSTCGTVNLSATTQVDVPMPAGFLQATPSPLTFFVDHDAVANATLNIKNNGPVAASYLIGEVTKAAPLAPLRQPAPSASAPWPAVDHPEELAPADRSSRSEADAPMAWGTGAGLPGLGRYRSAGTSCDGKTYYLFGGNNGTAAMTDALRYDPATNAWTTLTPAPKALMSYQAACIDNLVYLVGGYDPALAGGSHTNSFLIYDTVANSWRETTWPRVRTPMLATYNGMLYAFGGNPSASNETWMYDPASDSWTQRTSAATGAAYGVFVTVGDKILHVSGTNGTNALTTVQRYDPVANSWSAAGPQLSAGRLSPLAVYYGTKLYVIGGTSDLTNYVALGTSVVYDPTLWPGGSWAADAETMANPAWGMAGDCVNNRIWGAGGIDGTVVSAVNRYKDDGAVCHFSVPDIPWLSESPVAGSVNPNTTFPVTLTFDSNGLLSGLFRAQLRIFEGTPYTLPWVPVNMNVRFLDVADTYSMQAYIYGLAGAGVTNGCADHTYCPNGTVTRAQMATFLARAKAGSEAAVPVSGTVPAVGTYNCAAGGNSLFTDISPTVSYCPHVHYVYSLGITQGCTTTTYCPASAVKRSAMAMFLARAMAGGDGSVPVSGVAQGSAYDCSTGGTSLFSDVGTTAQYCRHVHYIYSAGVTSGCVVGQYCPNNNVNRAQMAKFLVLAFTIPYLH